MIKDLRKRNKDRNLKFDKESNMMISFYANDTDFEYSDIEEELEELNLVLKDWEKEEIGL